MGISGSRPYFQRISAHAKHVAPDAQLLAAEIAATRPLAVVMAESVASLREWAKDRTVPAD